VSTGGGRTGPAGGPGVRILVAHDDPTARDDLVAQLEASGRVEVVGTARSGDAAVALARKHAPDIVLVAEHLPAQGGPAVVEAVGALLPACGAILLLEELTADSMQRAMAVGARQIVPMPPPPGELLQAIGQVHAALAERRSAGSGVAPPPVVGCGGQIVAVFSLKGGVGCTTVAANLAVAIRQEMGLRVALVDASLPLGDIGTLLDLPSTRSLTDLVGVRAQGDEAAAVEDALTTHGRSGVRVVQAPHRAELAETVTGDLLQRALGTLRAHHEYVVVDTYAALDERVLPVLELADTILLVLTPDVAAIKSAAVFLPAGQDYPGGDARRDPGRDRDAGGGGGAGPPARPPHPGRRADGGARDQRGGSVGALRARDAGSGGDRRSRPSCGHRGLSRRGRVAGPAGRGRTAGAAQALRPRLTSGAPR